MIIVTGGAGFIGSNLVAALNQQLATRTLKGPLVVVDRLGSGDKWRNLSRHRVEHIIPPEDFPAFLEKYKGQIEIIFHMGASSSTVERDVDFILAQNLAFSLMIWDYCVAHECRLIYASSAATYGDGSLGFVDDNHPDSLARLCPLNPYGWSKALVDSAFKARAERGEAPPQWVGLKFFNVYGPNEYHKGGQRSVALQIFEQIDQNGRVQLFRSHHPDYEDGGQMRDFVWVGDCVDMMLHFLLNPDQSGIFNCGSGKARSFLDLAKACFKAAGKDPQIDWIDTPESIRSQYQYFTEASMERAIDAGWKSPPTSLEQGVHQYYTLYTSDHPYR